MTINKERNGQIAGNTQPQLLQKLATEPPPPDNIALLWPVVAVDIMPIHHGAQVSGLSIGTRIAGAPSVAPASSSPARQAILLLLPAATAARTAFPVPRGTHTITKILLSIFEI